MTRQRGHRGILSSATTKSRKTVLLLVAIAQLLCIISVTNHIRLRHDFELKPIGPRRLGAKFPLLEDNDGWKGGPCASAASLTRFLHSTSGAFSKHNPLCPTAAYNNIHVAIPFYNLDERTISDTIQTVRGQNYPRTRVSVWVYDDGSDREGAEEILNKVCDVSWGSSHVFDFSPREKYDWLYASNVINVSGLHQIEKPQYMSLLCFRSKQHFGLAGSKYWLFHLVHAVAEPNDVVLVLEGGDRLTHSMALHTVNQKYIDTSAWFTYGSCEGEKWRNRLKLLPVLPAISGKNEFTAHIEPSFYGCPHTFKAHLLNHISRIDFLHEDGSWLVKETNHRYVYRMLELSGYDRVGYISNKIYKCNRKTSDFAVTPADQIRLKEGLNSSSRLELPIHVVLLCWRRAFLLPSQFVWLQQQEELDGHQIHLHIVNNDWEEQRSINQAVANFTRWQNESLIDSAVTSPAPMAITVVHNDRNKSMDIFARYIYVHQLRRSKPMDAVIFLDDDQYWPPTFVSSLLKDHKPKGMTTWYGKVFKRSEKNPEATVNYWNSSISYWDIALGQLWPEVSTFKSAGPGGSILDTNLWLLGDHLIGSTDGVYRWSRIDDLWVSYVLDALLGWEIRRLTPPMIAVDIGFVQMMKQKPNVKRRLEMLIGEKHFQQVEAIAGSQANRIFEVGTFNDPTVNKQSVMTELQFSFRWDIFDPPSVEQDRVSSVILSKKALPSSITLPPSHFNCSQVNDTTVVRELGAGSYKNVYEVVLPNGVPAAAKRCNHMKCIRRHEIENEASYFHNLHSQFGKEAVQFYGECSFSFGVSNPLTSDLRKSLVDFTKGPTLFIELGRPLMSHWSKKKEVFIPKSDAELEDLRTIARQYDAYVGGPIRLEGDNGYAQQYIFTQAGIRHVDFGYAKVMPPSVTSVLSHNCDVLLRQVARLDSSDARLNCTEAYSREIDTQPQKKFEKFPMRQMR